MHNMYTFTCMCACRYTSRSRDGHSWLKQWKKYLSYGVLFSPDLI